MFTRIKKENSQTLDIIDMNIQYIANREQMMFTESIIKPKALSVNNQNISSNVCYIPITYTPTAQTIDISVVNNNSGNSPYYNTYLITENGSDFVTSTLSFQTATTNLLGESLEIGKAFCPNSATFTLRFGLVGSTNIKAIIITAVDNEDLVDIQAEVV